MGEKILQGSILRQKSRETKDCWKKIKPLPGFSPLIHCSMQSFSIQYTTYKQQKPPQQVIIIYVCVHAYTDNFKQITFNKITDYYCFKKYFILK